MDIAAESANLARQQIFTVQASAAMVAQANSSNNVALTLLQWQRSSIKKVKICFR